ncbi:MAG: nucleoside deaminase [SAR202 cluster bacterium]|nr:nucleoside deaminase [SAR202 cluster bacterium]
MPNEHEGYMRMAIEEGRKGNKLGNSPVGSVIVKGGKVVAKGHNLANSDLDVTAHAETVALRNGGPKLGHLDFTGCTLYTTYEPCLMCAGAIVFAGVETLVMGGNYNPNWGRYGNYSVEKAFALVERSSIKVVRGVLVEECEAMTWEYRAKVARGELKEPRQATSQIIKSSL